MPRAAYLERRLRRAIEATAAHLGATLEEYEIQEILLASRGTPGAPKKIGWTDDELRLLKEVERLRGQSGKRQYTKAAKLYPIHSWESSKEWLKRNYPKYEREQQRARRLSALAERAEAVGAKVEADKADDGGV